jgi:ribosomal protein L29
MMDYRDIAALGEKELRDLLSETREALRLRRFQAAEHQLRQMHLLGNAKKTIARILSVLRAKKNSSV